MLKISHAGCLRLTSAISSQFSVEMCASSKNREKFTKNLFLRNSGSFKVIDVNKSKKPVTSACYDKQHVWPICNRFHIIRANNGKMTSFLGGTPLRRPRSKGTPASSGTKFCHDKLETLGQPQWRFRDPSLHRFDTIYECDRQTDRRPDDGKDARSILLSRVKRR